MILAAKSIFGSLRLAACALATLVLTPAPLSAALISDTFYGLFWQATPSHWVDAGKRLYGEEIGKPVGEADVLVAVLDINQDTIVDILVYPINPKLCGEPVCEPRLYSFVNDRYHERIAGLGDAIKTIPAYIEMSPWRYGIYRSLKFDASILYWDGSGRFKKMYSVLPSTVDDKAFIAACSTAPGVVEEARDAGISPPEPAAQELCGCVAYQLAERQVDQSDMDRLSAGPEDIKSYRLSTLYSESYDACRILNYWQPWPQPDTFPPRKNDARGFYDACSRQEWVIDSSRTGSPHRAMALCGCVAEALATQDLQQSSVDLLAQLYRDEITEEDVTESDPSIVETGDSLAEACVDNLRHADYTNGIDRPGSPKPFKPEPGYE